MVIFLISKFTVSFATSRFGAEPSDFRSVGATEVQIRRGDPADCMAVFQFHCAQGSYLGGAWAQRLRDGIPPRWVAGST